jgi:exopolysaccharide biosynthesis polyprenyl glycosylphosphotransferase
LIGGKDSAKVGVIFRMGARKESEAAAMSRKRLPVWRTLLVMASDAVAIGMGLLGAYWLRFHSPLTTLWPVTKGWDPEWYRHMLPLAWLAWLLALRLENLYRRRSRVLDFNVVRRIVTGSILAVLVLIAWNFFFRAGEYSRLVVLIMLAVGMSALIVNRLLLHYLFRWMLVRKGLGQSRAAILGSGPLARRVWETLSAHPEQGMRPVGMILAHGTTAQARSGDDPPALGRVDALEAILAEHRIDELILAEPGVEREHLLHILLSCERAMAVFRVVPEVNELLMSAMVVETIDGIPLLGIRETSLQGWNAALKRLMDVAVALAGLTLTAPAIAFLAWLIWRKDRMRPFYLQERMGIDGRLFRMIKLRTMQPDAEEGTGPTFADDFDPRCTPLGALLRRTHLDELPQLINVLRGDMSLVGPRPERPYFIEQFREDLPRYMARHKVRSGITGWAQINGLCGRHGSVAERLKYDLYYIENWSLWLDLKILLKTLFGQQRPGPAGQ